MPRLADAHPRARVGEISDDVVAGSRPATTAARRRGSVPWAKSSRCPGVPEPAALAARAPGT